MPSCFRKIWPRSSRLSPEQGPVSRKSRKRFGPEKPFVRVRSANSVKLIFSYVVKGIKIKITKSFVPRDDLVVKIQRELCHPKCPRKVSGLSRNRPQERPSSALGREEEIPREGGWFYLRLQPIKGRDEKKTGSPVVITKTLTLCPELLEAWLVSRLRLVANHVVMYRRVFHLNFHKRANLHFKKDEVGQVGSLQ